MRLAIALRPRRGSVHDLQMNLDAEATTTATTTTATAVATYVEANLPKDFFRIGKLDCPYSITGFPRYL